MKNSKKGSSIVFITLIVATLITVVLTIMMQARGEYINSRADGLLNLAGDSVMSEYDYHVQRDYGLFVLGGTRTNLEGTLRSYVDYGLSDLSGIRTSTMSLTGSGYSLANGMIIKSQIVEHMKYAQVQGLLDSKFKIADSDNNMKEETLRNGATIVSLPSYDMPSLSLTSMAETVAKNIQGGMSALKEGSNNYLINRYILSHFNNMRGVASEDHFFKNEVEYVLGGELSDKANEHRVKMAITAIRFPMNLEHILTDPEKMEALLAAAEILTPEAAPVTQMALATTWAYMESDNDVELLLTGHKVDFKKDKTTWAVNLDTILDGIGEGVCKPRVEKGNDYDDYLQMLLFFQNEDVKMARIMDLIQINMRMNYDKTFVMAEHCVGIHVSAKVNGRNYNYEKKY